MSQNDLITPTFTARVLRCLTTSAADAVERDYEAGCIGTLPLEYGERLRSSSRPRFTLVELIGSGTHGEVFKAIDHMLSDDDHEVVVAIKQMPPGSSLGLAIREARAAIDVRHPNVAAIYGAGVDEDDEYLVMEYVPGGTLMELLEREPLPWPPRKAAAFISQVAAGLAALHGRGLIHCDLKPQNILLAEDGTPKISDFGVSTWEGRAPLEGDGARAAGCMAFMPPEQYDGRPELASDQFSLAGILYWMLTGRLPFGDTMESIRERHQVGIAGWPIPSARATNPEVPGDLDAICRRALAPHAEDRYPTVERLRDDLDSFNATRPVTARPAGPLRRIVLWARRRPLVAVGVVAITITACVALFVAGRMHGEIRQSRRTLSTLAESMGVVQRSLQQWDGRPGRQFHVLWYSEWLFGPSVFDDPRLPEVWRDRVALLRNMAAEAHRPSLEAGLTDLALAYWLARGGESGEALRVAERSRGSFRGFDQADSIHDIITAIELRALANGANASAALALASRIEQHLPRLNQLIDGAPLQSMLAEAMERLYGPGLLEDPSSAAHWASKRAALEAPLGPNRP